MRLRTNATGQFRDAVEATQSNQSFGFGKTPTTPVQSGYEIIQIDWQY
jgi:hypothetical protein